MYNNLKVLPEPKGDYKVGVNVKDIKYKHFDGSVREVSAMIFYPGDDTEGKESFPYSFKEVIDATNEMLEDAINVANEMLVKNIISYDMLDVKTHCYKDIKISNNNPVYPVLIFSHGYSGHVMQNTVLCSELASFGYIVVSIGHPGEGILKYSDGRVALFNKDLLNNSPEKEKKEIEIREAILKCEDEESLIILLDKFYEVCGSDNKIGYWVEDAKKTVDYLEKLNSGQIDSIFNKKLRLHSGIGITGHSFGGTTAAQACYEDSRFTCGINIDGANYGVYRGKDIKKPFMTIGSDRTWKFGRDVYRHNSEDVYHLIISKIEHIGFSDLIFVGRQLQQFGVIGEYDMYGIREILTMYHLYFFDKYLLGKPRELNELKYKDTKFNVIINSHNK